MSSNIARRPPVTIRSLTTDADLLTAADAGELWHVEGGVARRVSRSEVAVTVNDEEHGQTWLLMIAPTSDDALELAASYDSHAVRSLERGLREADGVLALKEAP